MTTQQGESISSDLDKVARSRDSSPNFDDPSSSRRAHRDETIDPTSSKRSHRDETIDPTSSKRSQARTTTTTATTATTTTTTAATTDLKSRRPFPRQDTSESMQPEFCDEEISISVPPPKQVNNFDIFLKMSFIVS